MTERMKPNAMEELAKASFFVTDAAKGLLGTWKVEEEGWGEGDRTRALEEFYFCLRTLKEAGFKDAKKVADRAPFTANIRVGAFYKKFEGDKRRWVTVIVGDRFGFDATFEVHDKAPWT